MIDKNTVGIIRKPHISYDTFSESWFCCSGDGPWDICIGAGESVVEAYGDWLLNLGRSDVRINLSCDHEHLGDTTVLFWGGFYKVCKNCETLIMVDDVIGGDKDD